MEKTILQLKFRKKNLFFIFASPKKKKKKKRGKIVASEGLGVAHTYIDIGEVQLTLVSFTHHAQQVRSGLFSCLNKDNYRICRRYRWSFSRKLRL